MAESHWYDPTERELAGMKATLASLGITAGGGSSKYDPALQRYNLTASNTQLARLGESRAQAGDGLCHAMALGTSLTAGSGASQATSWPSQFRKQLAARGFPIAGTGWILPGGNPADARITLANGAGTYTGNASALATNNGNAGATLTMVSDLPGTVVEFAYVDVPGPFTYKIDGGSAVTVTPGNTGAVIKVSVGGQADTTHTLLITWTTTNFGFVAAVGCRRTSGLIVSNFGIAGALTPDLPNLTPYSLFNVAKTLAPDVSYVEYGTNDGTSNQVALTAAVNALRSAGSDVILLTPPPRTATGGSGSDQGVKVYAVADALNVPLIDWGDRFGVAPKAVIGQPAQTAAYNALPAAWLPGDGTHFTADGYADVATMVRAARGL